MPRKSSSILGSLTSLQQVSEWITLNFKIDMGSSCTRIVVNNKLLWHQPTCLAIDRRSGSVVEIGNKALGLMGKAPAHIGIVFPIKNGRVAEIEYAQKYLQTIVKLVLIQLHRPLVVFLSAEVSAAVALSPVEKSMMLRVIHGAGFQAVKLIAKPQALLANAQASLTPKSNLDNVLFIDIGSQTTEIAVFVQNQILKAETLTVGGNDFTQAIENAIRLNYQALISWPMAEKIKLQQRNLQLIPSENTAVTHKSSMRVTDALSRTPKTIYIERTEVESVLRSVADELAAGISSFLRQLPSELLASVMEQGARMSGGGSELPGLLPYLEYRLQLPCVAAQQPELEIIWGIVAHSKT